MHNDNSAYIKGLHDRDREIRSDNSAHIKGLHDRDREMCNDNSKNHARIQKVLSERGSNSTLTSISIVYSAQ